MILGSINGDKAVIEMSTREALAFFKGKKVVKRSEDSRGEFEISVKLTRKRKPRRKARAS